MPAFRLFFGCLLVLSVLYPADVFAGRRDSSGKYCQSDNKNKKDSKKEIVPNKGGQGVFDPSIEEKYTFRPLQNSDGVISPEGRAEAQAGAARIDAIVDAKLAEMNIKPNPAATDEQFLRRVYLDICGTIPTLTEVKFFLDSKNPNKRADLIDNLLNSEGYADHHFNWWGDVFRLHKKPNNNQVATPYLEWFREQLRANRKYNELVYEMLTAEGNLFENPATGFILRDSGMELDGVANLLRVFAATRIECAQCHDHPFDRWSQKEFYEVASYMWTARTRGGGASRQDRNRIHEELAEIHGEESTKRYKFDGLFRQTNFQVTEQRDRHLRFPKSYAYDDAYPGQSADFRVLFGDQPFIFNSSPREAFADWLTSPQNPRFTKSIVNRLWAKAFGIGIFDPIDNLMDDTIISNEKLLAGLEEEMRRADYDIKEFLRMMYNTRAYQREATAVDPGMGQSYYYQGPVLRRMTAEQLWDSFLTVAIVDPYQYRMPDQTRRRELMMSDWANVNVADLEAIQGELNDIYRNGVRHEQKRYKYKGVVLARACELEPPYSLSHFLGQFGSGDRSVIGTASSEGSVPQILQMFNGDITHMLLEEGSVLYRNVTSAKSLTKAIDNIFLTILARYPNDEERRAAMQEVKANGNPGFGNIIWALVNTREFMFVQ
ncbi:DUF1549 domain-containing protein [Calycomorphotria hydatis]|uniref:DUF1549 domain-containing protein n=1 Tax=Calycomorphotria hydatis TaxID=2528027 RepID=A0A517T577_9PLAN|nr:DUF1549 domain-containing protein [Calycomorphotria hydatis]QDT63491.1 hypothetical protein V22_07130 [Calycomorphotria hydatis]